MGKNKDKKKHKKKRAASGGRKSISCEPQIVGQAALSKLDFENLLENWSKRKRAAFVELEEGAPRGMAGQKGEAGDIEEDSPKPKAAGQESEPAEWPEINKVRKLCEPIMEYLSAHHNPYWEICISESGVQAKQAEFWIPSGWQPSDADDCPVD